MACKRPGDAMEAQLPKRGRGEPSNEEIVRAVEERELARKAKDYSLADQLRSSLRARGVELLDGDREWRAVDGRRGAIPNVRGADTVSSLTPEAIVATLREREAARNAHRWAEADEMRQSLRSAGVEIDDKRRMWSCGDGKMGLIPGKLSEEHVTHIVALREAARTKRDFTTADQLRTMLRDVGVRLEDKQRMWVMEDGQTGPYTTNQPDPRPAQPLFHLPQQMPFTLQPQQVIQASSFTQSPSLSSGWSPAVRCAMPAYVLENFISSTLRRHYTAFALGVDSTLHSFACM